jgi:hypothetical protein
MPRIPSDIGLELCSPEFGTGRWSRGEATAVVAVPETAMNHDDRPPFRQNDVGLPGKISRVNSEPEAEPMESGTKAPFG